MVDGTKAYDTFKEVERATRASEIGKLRFATFFEIFIPARGGYVSRVSALPINSLRFYGLRP